MLTTTVVNGREVELGGRYLGTDLPDATHLLHDAEGLRSRLANDGFVLIRGLLPRESVLDARESILERPAVEWGSFEPAESLRGEVVPVPETPQMLRLDWHDPALRRLTHSQPMVDVFTRILGGPVVTYDFKWLRAVGPGYFTRLHWDSIFWERGQVYSAWVPLGDIPIEQGPLAMLTDAPDFVHEAKQAPRDLRQSFKFMSSIDAFDILDRTGGRLQTTDFQAGDVIIFGMYTPHTSLANQTNRLRLSVDVRFQLESEPLDDQYMGEWPSHLGVLAEIRHELVLNPAAD